MVRMFVSSFDELKDSVRRYSEEMHKLERCAPPVAADAIALLPRFNVWIAIPDGKNGFYVAPSKAAGYRDVDLASYRELRSKPEGSPDRLNGSEADRRTKFPGYHDINLAGNSHPAAMAVRNFVERFGKVPKMTARVRIYDQLTSDRKSAGHEAQPGKDIHGLALDIPSAKRAVARFYGCEPGAVTITITG